MFADILSQSTNKTVFRNGFVSMFSKTVKISLRLICVSHSKVTVVQTALGQHCNRFDVE